MKKHIYLYLLILLSIPMGALAQTPTVTASVTNQSICSGGSFTIAFSSDLSGTTFSWTRDNLTNATGLAASGTGNIIGTLVNTTTAPVTVRFTITPDNAGNTGTPVSATIVVANESILYSTSGQSLPYPGGNFSLSATGNGSLHWYDASTGGNELFVGSPFTTSASVTTTFYVSNIISPGRGQVVTPNQTSTFFGNVRGYFFRAPTSFVITSLNVPTTASSGAQSVAVVRFNNQTLPPIFDATTNDFETLFLTQNSSFTANIPVNIAINEGDIIGILGNRGGVCSYSPSPGTVTIDGYTVTVSRLGMQYDLRNTEPRDLWRDLNGSIGRVDFDYKLPDCATPRTAVTATVEPCPVAQVISVNVTNTLSSANCNAKTDMQVKGDNFVLQGPDGYVYSYVYRKAGTYTISNNSITRPGTYTVTAYSTLCGTAGETRTFVVSGEACR